MVVNETTLIKLCKAGKVSELKEMSKTKMKLSSKSRVKEYDNLFQRALHESLNLKSEKKVVEVLCNWAGDVSDLLTEKQLLALLARGKYDIFDCVLNYGVDLGKKSYITKYKSVFDRMFKESIMYGRIEEVAYLMSRFDINYIDQGSIIRILANEEDMISHIDRKLKDRGLETMLSFLMNNGIDMEKIIESLN